MDVVNYYKIMGLKDKASAADVKQAYRKLAKKFHPDVSKEPHAEARFQEIGEAYEVLSDTEKRAKYDRCQALRTAASRGGYPPNGTHFREGVLRSVGKDVHHKLVVPLEEAVNGGQRTLKLAIPALDMRGRTQANSKTLNVKIPAGVLPLQRFRLSGEGNPGIGGGKPGDLLLQIEFAPHPLFSVAGLDVLLTLPISPWEAALGAQVRVPTLKGLVSLKIPEGSVSGKKIRLKGRGLGLYPSGDQIINLQVTLPAQHTAKAKMLYQQLAELESPFNPREI